MNEKSGHWTNTGMAKFINDNLYNYKSDDEKSMNPFRWYRLQNGEDVSKYRETINGFPCRLILINDGSTPLNEGQNEPTPGNTKDMGIFNFNNDKDNVTTLGFNSDVFPNCASYEVTANSDTSAGAFMSYKSNPIIEIAKRTVGGTEYYATMYMGPLLPAGSTVKTDAEISAATRYAENAFDMYGNTIQANKQDEGVYIFMHNNVGTHYRILFNVNTCPTFIEINDVRYNVKIVEEYPENVVKDPYPEDSGELAYLKESFELRHPDADDVAEDWGFMGVEAEVPQYTFDYHISSTHKSTTYFSTTMFDSITVNLLDDARWQVSYYDTNGEWKANSDTMSNGDTLVIDKSYSYLCITDRRDDRGTKGSININGMDYLYGTRLDSNMIKEPYQTGTINAWSTEHSLKALIDWVDNCTDEEFVADFEEHFHKDYTLRYYCLVVLCGMVDNMGKNMMLDTADNKIFFPRFYDIDTCCSYDNSGQLKFDVDIEMEQGYWNTSSSRLWTRIRDLMHDDIVTTYNDMRQNGVSYENMMHYIYDEQIAKIPQTYYNKDYDVKYAPFADSYIGMAHGDTYEHVKRWLKQRFTFVDTLFDYAPSYNNDVLTIRANTTELMTLEIETYTPVYQHLSWYNGQMDKKKIDGKVSVEFSGTAQAATDQEVLIYGGSNVKSIKGITSMNPNRMLIGSATKLVEIDAHDCPLLADINANKANLSPHEYLNKVDLSNCPLLEGNLRLNNSPLVQEINIRGTKITGMNLPSSIRNLQVLRLPNTITELTLNDAGMLHTLDFDEGVALQSVSMTNCNALENVINFDLLQTPSITLNNSYNTVAELYFRDTTNLSLSNMSNLERVIYTPNNEYETFELINVANAPDYIVTTFNCPKLSTFMTTAPYRESYNNTSNTISIIDKGKEPIVSEDVFIPKDDRWSGLDMLLKVNDGFIALSEGHCSTDYIESSVGTTYTLTSSQPGTWVGIAFFDKNKQILTGSKGTSDTGSNTLTLVAPKNTVYVRFFTTNGVSTSTTLIINTPQYKEAKDYGNIQPNTTFTANSIDISNTQFTDVKLLCTTDTNTLKLPTTVKNFYCDSSFDLDTDYLEDGEYDVVHGELVEPYTTDYESEVVRTSTNETSLLLTDICTIPTSYINEGSGEAAYHKSYSLSDFIEVASDTPIKLNFWVCRVSEFNANKSYIKQTTLYDNGTQTLTLNSNCRYIRVHVEPYLLEGANAITCTPLVYYTPNLIPSSADGSLIFSMYAPSNAVAPASGTWDLHGLQFDNFHTFGMNNDVIKTYNTKQYNIKDKMFFNKKIEMTWDGAITSRNFFGVIVDGKKYCFYIYADRFSYIYTDWAERIVAEYTTTSTTSWKISVDDNSITLFVDDMIAYKNTFNNLQEYYETVSEDNHCRFESLNGITSVYANLDKDYSIVMPARYDDYNITIKNAKISPKTHNTMLYPLLVNEDNPITGTLDYTNYAGKHLSWSFAYTDEEYVNIIQPKDELLNSYEYRYNAFHDTEYEFDNPYEIARYTSSASGVLPNFNAEFTYTYDETDNGDGTYTTKIYTNSLDNLPTRISFYGKTTLLTVDKLNTSNVANFRDILAGCSSLTSVNAANWDTSNVTDMHFMFGYNNVLSTIIGLDTWDTKNVINMDVMFQNCHGLTSLDLSNWDTSKVTNMRGMFNGCYGLTSLDLSGFDTSNVTDMGNMFQSCSSLTSLNLSSFDTSKVISMQYMFDGCTILTSLNLSGFDTGKVTKMFNMFTNCIKLTSLDLSSFDTGEVTDMNCMFQSCSQLTSLDLSSFNTGKVTDMLSMFRGCSGLTSLNLSGFNTSNVKSMGSMFRDCSGLTSLNLSGFDTGNVTNMGEMFYGCSNLTSLDLSSFDTSEVINMSYMFSNCSKLTSLNLSSFDTSEVTNMRYMFQLCSSLTSLDLSSFDTSTTTDMQYIFAECENLEHLKGNFVLNDAICGNMFYKCLKAPDLSEFKMSGTVTGVNYMFGSFGFGNTPLAASLDLSDIALADGCEISKYTFFRNTVADIYPFTNINSGCDLSQADYLTQEVLLRFINNLAEVTTSPTLTLGTTNLAKLTEDQIAIATNKGWNIS